MRKVSTKIHFEIFFENMKYFNNLLQSILDFDSFNYSNGAKEKVSIYDKRQIFEAFVLKVDSEWQSLIRSLFVSCLSIDTTRYSESTCSNVPKHLPWNVCRAMVNGLGFFDFRNLGDIKNLGKKYLVDECNPFKITYDSYGKKIDEFYSIRNFIAHKSHFSYGKLKLMYKNRYNIDRFIKPGKFLMTTDRKEDQIRFGVYMDCMWQKAEQMKKILKKIKYINKNLQPDLFEFPFLSYP